MPFVSLSLPDAHLRLNLIFTHLHSAFSGGMPNRQSIETTRSFIRVPYFSQHISRRTRYTKGCVHRMNHPPVQSARQSQPGIMKTNQMQNWHESVKFMQVTERRGVGGEE